MLHSLLSVTIFHPRAWVVCGVQSLVAPEATSLLTYFIMSPVQSFLCVTWVPISRHAVKTVADDSLAIQSRGWQLVCVAFALLPVRPARAWPLCAALMCRRFLSAVSSVNWWMMSEIAAMHRMMQTRSSTPEELRQCTTKIYTVWFLCRDWEGTELLRAELVS